MPFIGWNTFKQIGITFADLRSVKRLHTSPVMPNNDRCGVVIFIPPLDALYKAPFAA